MLFKNNFKASLSLVLTICFKDIGNNNNNNVEAKKK